MYRISNFMSIEGSLYKIFLSDDQTGISVKDTFTVPGVFSSLTSENNTTFKLRNLSGSIGQYSTSGFFLTVETGAPCEDLTAQLTQLLTVPVVAQSMLLNRYSDEEREVLSDGIAMLHFCEEVTAESRLCLPTEVFSEMSADVMQKMQSVRKSYSLRPIENQEVFQQAYDQEYSIRLPSLDDIHSGKTGLITALDIIRVVAPYRKQERPGVFSYKPIYHTPYFQVDIKLRGMIPSYMKWLNGYATNDMLDIQPYERKMFNNLQMFNCSDLSRYVAEITTGILLDTPLGSLLSKLCVKKDLDVLQQLCTDIQERSDENVGCNITFTDVERVYTSGWNTHDVESMVLTSLRVKPDYLRQLILERPADRRIIDCDTLPFTLPLTDAQEEEYTDLFIKNGYISGAMQKFLLELCRMAYRVNWGHTGATQAINRFNIKAALPELEECLAKFVSAKVEGEDVDPNDYPFLFVKEVVVDEDDILFGDATENNEISSDMNYYMTDETYQRIRDGSLEDGYFTQQPSAVQTSEAAIVEYWRRVSGENNLDNFLSSILMKTASPMLLVECFLKLMRWGDNKPKVLVLHNNPEVRVLFDLTLGMVTENTAIVNEEDLVKVNGCSYSFAGFLCSTSNHILKPDQIIGFVLRKDYGTVVKEYLASWLDLAEMAIENKIDIGEFVTITKMTPKPEEFISVEKYDKLSHELYVSEGNIKEGLQLKIQPKDLSALALLTTPGVMDSTGYIKSLRNDHLLTKQDRQYDLLRRYVDALNKFYTQAGGVVNAVSNSIELLECARTFAEIYTNGSTGKEDANTARAGMTMKRLNLAGDNGDSPIVWDDSPLDGKFFIISDRGMQSPLPPIDFTDPGMRDVAAKANNRVILLLLALPDKFVFCRKDIKVNEIKIVKGKDAKTGKEVPKLGHNPYSAFEATINNLSKGVECRINKLPVLLHSSLKEFF